MFHHLQSPAGCREQVGDQPGHLSKGAFCFHWHRRAGLPHHRRGQYSQRRCTNSSWCESEYLYQCLYFKVIYTEPCTQLLLPVSYLSPPHQVSYCVNSFCTQISKSVFSLPRLLFADINMSPITISASHFLLSSLCKCTNLSPVKCVNQYFFFQHCNLHLYLLYFTFRHHIHHCAVIFFSW